MTVLIIVGVIFLAKCAAIIGLLIGAFSKD